MESNLNQDGVPRPSYVFSADPVARPSEINFDGIKLDLSHEFSLVASNPEANSLGSKDYLQVCLRIRPFTQSEKEHASEGCVHVLDSQTVVLKDPQSVLGRLSEKSSGQMAQKFSFSKVFGPETSQKEFFQGCIMQPVKDLLKGQSRLIFTYGLTNSGKTYTFQGTEENVGILPRTLNVLFDSLQERLYTRMNLKPYRCREYLRLSSDQEKEESASKSALLRQTKEITIHNDSYDTLCGSLTNSLTIPEFEESIKNSEQANVSMDNIKFSVWISFFEIYNECVYDLLVPVSSKFQKRKMLRLSQDVKGYSFIKDLQWIQVSDSKEAYRLLKLGVKHQSVAFTKLNNASSRSHSIFTIRILQIEDSEVPQVIRVSELSLCDLAGSERSMKTQNEGERLRETGNINTSLLTLGKCINVLKNSEKLKFQQHVPFRESKLTHYFQSFFNGKGKICMIVNISQCCFAYDETLNVLKFSAIAQRVYVPDILNSSQEKSCGSIKSSQDVPLDNTLDNKILNVKRTTISWENSLEDLAEVEDLVEDLEKDAEKQNVETELTEEDLDKTEEYKVSKSHENTEAIACLQLKFNQIKAELAKTKEELIKTQEELKKRENESKSWLQEPKAANKVDTSLVVSKSACSEAVGMPKSSRTEAYSERKRLSESELQQDEPPVKKGFILVTSVTTEDQAKRGEIQQTISQGVEDIRVLQETSEELKSHLLLVENELKSEIAEKVELNKQIVSLQQELASYEKKSSASSTEVQQIQASYESAIAELHVQKGVNQEQEEKIRKLSEEVEAAARSIRNNISQIKLMQAIIDKLRSLDSASQISNIDSLNLHDLSNGSQEDNLLNAQFHLSGDDILLSKQVQEHHIQELNKEGYFHSSIEAIWEECKEILKASSKKSHQIRELEQQIETLQAEVKCCKDENNELKAKEREEKNQEDLLQERDRLIQQFKEEMQEKDARLDVQVQLVGEGKKALSELTQDVTSYKAKIKELEIMLETKKDECGNLAKLQEDILEKESIILKLEGYLEESQANLQDSIKNTRDLKEKDFKLKEEITQLTINLQDVKNSLQLKEEEQETNMQETERLTEELAASSALIQNLRADLERKEEDYAELKDKLTDAKKQIAQVQKEVAVMRDEEKLLRNKINELEKKKNQYSQEIDMKQRTIQQLQDQLSNQKAEDTIQQYEKVCKDLSMKEKIIKDMRMTLEEQEQTQAEQDQALAAKLEEAEWLASELEKWKEKCNDLESKSKQRSNKEPEDSPDMLSEKLRKLQDELQDSEEKYKADRKKWLDEKMMLIAQAKEAENLRNKEMKKYAEDRERCLKQQNQVEVLTAQLAEKNDDLQKWREERDQLVTALERELKALISSNKQKDIEIEQLKNITSETSEAEKQTMNLKPGHTSSADQGAVETEPQSSASFEISRDEMEDGSVVLDSCEVSTENVQSTRFPKPELEIQFTPLRPNKMSVKRPGCATPVTVKISKARKRKSNEMEEELVKSENTKNSTPRINLKIPVSAHRNSSIKKEQKVSTRPSSKKTYCLRSQAPTIGPDVAAKKKEGTLQKFGDFLQLSPTILQSKAKKIIETMSSSKLSNAEVTKENISQPKRAKRKLYTNEISSPIDISGQVILMEQKVKESDHQILKRRLRTRMAK
uniref:kinesin-like protein KIF20B isoform X3 n=1 Tax=Jaculus jaculus TaxID=51337 RepID=UPI001E1B1DAC|nr:kinesin-like protein KIF20B isoform X3 [Jaculus jaculus]